MKKYFVIFLLFFSFSFLVSAEELEINSDKAILINLNDDSVLFEKNAKGKASVASLTKIMTAIVVLENVDVGEKVTIINDDWRGLREEDATTCDYNLNKEYTYLDLLYGLLLPSGADCANALARNVDKDNFINLMNNKAEELNMKDTHFSNVTGFDDKENYSTAYDMAILMKYAIKNETFKEIISTPKYTTDDGVTVYNTLNVYSEINNVTIPNVIGGKTGSTDDALTCLATIAEYDGVNYLLVTLNAKKPGQLLDAKNIYTYYMENYGYKTLLKKGDTIKKINTLYSKNDITVVKSLKDYNYYLKNDYDESKVNIEYDGLKKLSFRNKKGEKIGTLKIYYDDKLLEEDDVVLSKKIDFSFKKFFVSNLYAFITAFILIFVLLYYLFFKNNKKRDII